MAVRCSCLCIPQAHGSGPRATRRDNRQAFCFFQTLRIVVHCAAVCTALRCTRLSTFLGVVGTHNSNLAFSLKSRPVSVAPLRPPLHYFRQVLYYPPTRCCCVSVVMLLIALVLRQLLEHLTSSSAAQQSRCTVPSPISKYFLQPTGT